MSYAQGTTHYNFPQIAGTDRPTFADANEAFRTLDTKLYALEGSATEVDGRLDTAEGNIVELQNDVQTAQGTADTANGKGDTALEQIGITNTNVSQLTTRVGNKFDSVGIADPYDTAATYSVGDVVTYNGQRYRCTTAVTVAEPFDVTKWTGEDVETVLREIKSDLDNKIVWSTNPTTDQLKKAKKLTVIVGGTNHGTRVSVSPVPDETGYGITVSGFIYDGDAAWIALSNVKWNRVNGTLSIQRSYSQQGGYWLDTIMYVCLTF